MSFKLSVITDEVSQDLERASMFVGDFNLDGVEIRNVWGKPPQNLLEESDRIKDILAKRDLEVSAIASPFFKAELYNLGEYEDHLKILRRCVELAKKVGTTVVRGFTFWRNGSLEENIDEIVQRFQKPVEIMESEGLILGIENEPSTFVGNGRELGHFLSRIGSRNVKAVWDPGNDIWDLHGETPYPDGYNVLRGKIEHVHLKDGVRRGWKGEHQFVAFGEGEVDYRGQLRALKNDAYNGYLSLETHWRLKKQLSRDLLVRPGSADFSSSGEESSRICMNNLQDMLQDV
jgi:sugar phosphate isomerase/epimerase